MFAILWVVLVGAAGSAELDAGRDAYTPCGVCHGVRAQGVRDLHAPALSGLDAPYIVRQLEHYGAGVRGADPADTYGRQMAPLADTLHDDAAREAVAAYIVSLGPPPAADPGKGDPARGKAHYATCVACHGAQAEGVPAVNGTPLVGLDAAYLITQMSLYKKGLRGTHPKDTLGMQMVPFAAVVAEADWPDLAAYITTLRPRE